MPKIRSARHVSLAGTGTSREKPRAGFEDATPERLNQARAAGSALIDAGGVRRIAEPLDVLRSRNLLDRTDGTVNAALWQAGDRFREHWHRSRLDALATLDPSRPSVDGGAGGSLTPTEASLRHREHYRRAATCVGARLMPYVEGLVIDARPASALRGLVGDTTHARTADALVLERLREALHRLCDLWSMHPRRGPLVVRGWRDPADAPDSSAAASSG